MAIGLLESIHVHSVAGQASSRPPAPNLGRLGVAKLPLNLTKSLKALKEASANVGRVRVDRTCRRSRRS